MGHRQRLVQAREAQLEPDRDRRDEGPRPLTDDRQRLGRSCRHRARVRQTLRLNDDLDARLRRLEDRAAISDTVTKYAVAVDRRDWAMFADCFTDPVHADYSENGLPAADFARDDLVAIVRDAVTG